MFALDELRNIVHRSRTIERVHGNEVTHDGWLELLHVLAHTCRLKLEDTYGSSLLEEFVGLCIVFWHVVNIHIYAVAQFDILEALFDDSQRLESEEVHLDKTDVLHYVTVILGDEDALLAILVLYGTQWCIFGQVIRTDDDTTGVDTHLAHGVLQLLCIVEHGGNLGLAAINEVLELSHVLVAVLEINLGRFAFLILDVIGESAFGDITLDLIDTSQRNTLYASDIGDSRFGSHGAVGDDVRHACLAVLLCHPVQHFAATCIIKVGINIGEGYTVGIEESLEQQVVLQWVEVGDSQTVGYYRTCGTTTTRTYAHAQLFASCADKVHHDEEVTRETHGLHDMQLEVDTLLLLLGEGLTIALVCAYVGEVAQVVCLQLNAV